MTGAPRRGSIPEQWDCGGAARRRNRMGEVVEIAEEAKKYDREWLLFEVTEADEQQWPVRGRLLCHAKNRDEVYEVAMEHRNADLGLQFIFAGDPIPDDMYVVL